MGAGSSSFNQLTKGRTMPVSLKSFDDKIAELKTKKKELESKQAQQLLKNLSSEIGSSFSPHLAACIVKDSWASATQNQKESWLKSAEKFQFTKPRSSRKKASEESKTNHQS
jgi:hypothetical protein